MRRRGAVRPLAAAPATALLLLAAVPPSAEAHPGLGCFKAGRDPKAGATDHLLYRGPNLGVELCQRLCEESGFPVAVLRRGNLCYGAAANATAGLPQALDSTCDRACSDGSNATCGGGHRAFEAYAVGSEAEDTAPYAAPLPVTGRAAEAEADSASEAAAGEPLPADPRVPQYDYRRAHGIWDRSGAFSAGDALPVKLKGRMPRTKDMSWRSLEPSPGEFQAELPWEIMAEAVADGEFVKLQLGVGPSSPAWLYGDGYNVPFVEVDVEEGRNHDRWPGFPFYFDERYIKRQLRLIDWFADQVYSEWPDVFREIAPRSLHCSSSASLHSAVRHPNGAGRGQTPLTLNHWTDLRFLAGEHLLFIQVTTGATGDEVPYKGRVKPSHAEYDIDKTGEAWADYRRRIFARYVERFQGEQQPHFYLMFSGLRDRLGGPGGLAAWVDENVPMQGRKVAGLARGYGFNGHRDVIANTKAHAVDPQPGKRFWLTRSEMDKVYTRPLFTQHPGMQFYWSALEGLEAGLAIWDIKAGALRTVPEAEESFKFFNKFAGEILPGTATKAFIAFHRALDSSDFEAFPADEFGECNRGNRERYLRIAEAFAAWGAGVDDPEAATLAGQIAQRKSQGGFNDVGWEIASNNFARFIEQIQPDVHDQAYWRVGGPITAATSKYARFGRGFNGADRSAIYLDVHDGLAKANRKRGRWLKVSGAL